MRSAVVAISLLCAALQAGARELKYDDGKPDGARSVGGVGQAVWFDEDFQGASVRLHAARGACRMFEIAAVDRAGRILAQGAWEGRLLPETAGWVRLALPVDASEGVMVVVYFNEGEAGVLSLDTTEESHSTWYYGGRHHPVEESNWMVRLSSEAGEPPLAWPAGTLPAGDTVRADRGAAFTLWRSRAAHAVRFDRPPGTTLAGIELYAARTGRLTRPFTVTLCDGELRPIHAETVPAGRIPPDEGWAAIPLAAAPAGLPAQFWVLVDFDDSAADHVAVGVCRNPEAACAEAEPDGLFLRFPEHHAWMMRARLVKAPETPPRERPGADASDAVLVGEVAKKLFKALERIDRERLLGVLAPDAHGLDALRTEDPAEPLEGRPHRRFVRELARRVEGDRAVVVFATLQGPLLWDVPETLRRRLPPNRPLPAGPALFTTDGPADHSRPALFTVRLSKTRGTWGLRGWKSVDIADADPTRGLLAGADPEAAFDALAAARLQSLDVLEQEVRELEDAGQQVPLLVELARQRAEHGDFARSAGMAKDLPADARERLGATIFLEGRRAIAVGPPGANLKGLVDLADALLDGLEARWGLTPPGRGKPRMLVLPHEETGFAAHPEAWAYAEVIWFVPEEGMTGTPDVTGLARALVDAAVRLRDDAGQARRWIAAGMIAEASLASKETPASLAESVAGIDAARNTVEGCLAILVEASRRWGDAALGRALGQAGRRGAARETASGPAVSLDDVASALAASTKEGGAVRSLFEKGRD